MFNVFNMDYSLNNMISEPEHSNVMKYYKRGRMILIKQTQALPLKKCICPIDKINKFCTE